MPLSADQNFESVQKLVQNYECRVGLTRLTETTISEGPAALQGRAFNYLITPYIDSIQIYESLDSAFRMADLTMSDPVNWRSIAPLTGHEVISIAYKNGLSGPDTEMKILHFMIHNVIEEPTQNVMGSGFKKLILKLVEFPAYKLLISNQVYKTYPIDERNTPKQRFSDLVTDTLTSIKDFTKWYNLDIEPSTRDSVNFYIPNWLPLKVINYCKKYAISEKKNYPMYTFHIGSKYGEDKPTAYFKPIYSFVDSSSKFRAYGTSYQDVNKSNPQDQSQKQYAPTDVIQSYRFEYMDAQNTGILSGNTEVLFDYLEDNKYVSTDYDTYLKSKFKGLNPYVTYPYSHGNQWSSFYRSGFNNKEGIVNIKNSLFNEYASGILLKGVKCKSMASIYEGRSCGERAELIFNVAGNDERYDKMMSGAWITWSVTDHLINGAAFSTIYFINDGFVNLNDPSNTFHKINTITSDRSPDSIT